MCLCALTYVQEQREFADPLGREHTLSGWEKLCTPCRIHLCTPVQ
jgi:hypothetical protein